jgi:hypothetical protein
MESLYLFVDIASDWNKIQPLESVVIEIAEKTQECAKSVEG